jgi:hypothetical protein
VNGVAIYIEGGGDSRAGKDRLRQGMSAFLLSLRAAANRKRLHWRVVACGGRDGARDAFLAAIKTSPETFNVLLVDSEAPVSQPPRAHLKQRDGWTLRAVGDESIHLMIQVMETWIIADPDAMARYYDKHFLKGALPPARDRESVEKDRIYKALKHATAKTRKGEYHKIDHAADLLEEIDPVKVRRRCPSCERLFATLTQRIDAA